MKPSLPILLAAVATAVAPMAARAQAWPATVASAPRLVLNSPSPTLIIDRDTVLRRPWGVPPSHPNLRRQHALKLTPAAAADPTKVPSIAIRPKAVWFDDQTGVRLTPTKMAYKVRF